MAIFFSLALISLAARALATEAPIPGYGVEEMTWEVEVLPGQPPVSFNGTVEQLVAQASEINPDWEAKYITAANTAGADVESSSLSKRAPFVRRNCGPGYYQWHPANTRRIRDGIYYLSGIGGTATNGPGPGNCARVSCSYNSAIWWCNDVSRNPTRNSAVQLT